MRRRKMEGQLKNSNECSKDYFYAQIINDLAIMSYRIKADKINAS